MKHDAEPSSHPQGRQQPWSAPDNKFATDAATAFVVLAAMPGRVKKRGLEQLYTDAVGYCAHSFHHQGTGHNR
jgi:hypothetical protein